MIELIFAFLSFRSAVKQSKNGKKISTEAVSHGGRPILRIDNYNSHQK
jgi:hypothetical protein